MNAPLPLSHHSIDEIQHQPAGIWDLPIPPANVPPPRGMTISFCVSPSLSLIVNCIFFINSAKLIDENGNAGNRANG